MENRKEVLVEKESGVEMWNKGSIIMGAESIQAEERGRMKPMI